MTTIGELGEQIISQWLAAQDYTVLHHRWRCRWGEIDLIAQSNSPDRLVFVEVKTRSRGNWDAGGLLAITPQKQLKLCRTAAFFLAQYPQFSDYPCRFDVALVAYKNCAAHGHLDRREPTMQIGQAIVREGYHLILENYLESAFEAS